MRITDEGGDENGHNKPQSSIMDSIKARSQVAPADNSGTTRPWEKPKPREGHDPLSGRVTADVQSNKLKQLLGQIKAS
jgi:hypothetical protein